MDIKFRCSQCNAKIGAQSSMVGDCVNCPRCQTRLTIPAAELQAGTELAGYRIEANLGGGAMGTVFLANQVAMDRQVALKVLSPDLTSDDEYIERFLKEVRLLGNLSHKNIVTAFEAGMDGGHHYLAMSYVEGEDLESILEEDGALPEKDALRIVDKIAGALKYAWDEMEILHRDVKPANIMIDSKNEPRLMDLGISKQANDDQSLTLTGVAVGTPNYMSPEQAQGKRAIDCRSDIYALGATLYHLVTGDVPFEGESTMQVLTQVVTAEHRPVREVNPDISADCQILIDRMMEKDPDDRYQSWQELRQDIRKIRTGKHLHARPKKEKRPAAGAVAAKKSPLPWALAVIALALLIVALIIIMAMMKGG